MVDAAYHRAHYWRTRERRLALKAVARPERQRKLRAAVAAEKDRPCTDCGESYPYYVMQFDHMDGETKVLDVATALSRGWSIARLQQEIAKCEVVCANCHAIRTHKRRAVA